MLKYSIILAQHILKFELEDCWQTVGTNIVRVLKITLVPFSQRLKMLKKLMKIVNISGSKSRLRIRQVLSERDVNVEQQERYWVVTFLIGSSNDGEARRGCLTTRLA